MITTRLAEVAASLGGVFDASIGSIVSAYISTLVAGVLFQKEADNHVRYQLEFFVVSSGDIVTFYFLGIQNLLYVVYSRTLMLLDIDVEILKMEGWLAVLRAETESVRIRVLNIIGFTKRL